MNRKKLLLFIALPLGIILLLYLLNLFVKQKVESRLQELDSDVSYADLDVNIYFNRYRLEDLKTSQDQFSIGAKKVIFKGVSYSKLLFDGALVIDELEVQEPEIVQIRNRKKGEKKSSDEQVKIKRFFLSNGTFSSKESNTADASVYLRFPEVNLKPGEDMGNLQFESYKVKLDSVWLKMNAEHYINIGSAEAEDGRVKVSDFKIASFYPKPEFDRNIPYEKDRIDLKIPRITLQNLTFNKLNDTLHLTEPKMVISEAFLEIYRNKLLADDTRRKPLYGELLRKAAVKLNFEQVQVENSEIIYEELVQEGRQAGVIRFSGVEGEINHLNNLRDSLPEPKVSAQANFMRGTLVTLELDFPVFDDLSSFRASGGLGEIEGEALDPFIIPVMDFQVRGEINDISFNFYGNDDVMEGDFTMDYDSLKVELLKDDGTKKRNILSALANLLVENKGEAGKQEHHIQVERNKQRSFWNFLWLGLRKGFIETVEQF
ncbi:hypothetical protein [Salinimicrobium xinjiangense]|uniref:hypothetical protein n=1 Tax=Salinimicrobium xinjiangense TaxID=438596 RepID=UPI0003F5A9F2|nr:hypothetical protein [Salinimicrobium xinjiangense]